MEGKEWGGELVKMLFQGRETIWVEDVGVQGSDINCYRNGIGRGGVVRDLYNVKEVIGVLYI